MAWALETNWKPTRLVDGRTRRTHRTARAVPLPMEWSGRAQALRCRGETSLHRSSLHLHFTFTSPGFTFTSPSLHRAACAAPLACAASLDAIPQWIVVSGSLLGIALAGRQPLRSPEPEISNLKSQIANRKSQNSKSPNPLPPTPSTARAFAANPPSRVNWKLNRRCSGKIPPSRLQK